MMEIEGVSAENKNQEKLEFARTNARKALAPYAGKIIQVTYRTGFGRKMTTDDFLISELQEEQVWLDKTIYDHALGKLVPSGNSFQIPLEMVHIIVTNDKVIFPAKAKWKFKNNLER
jgi:hypothetical protein